MSATDLASSLLATHYSLAATLSPLAGDRDTNFLASTADGERYVCKLMHPDCREEAVAFQCAALAHLRASSLNLPRVVADRGGREWISVQLAGRQRILWVLRWCPGTLLANALPHTAAIQESFGRVMAQLDRDLSGFRHPAMHRGHRWELTRAAATLPLVPHVDADIRDEVAAVLTHFCERVAPLLAGLPQGVIHNDANDYNVLVQDPGGESAAAAVGSSEPPTDGLRVTGLRVTGLFDFGDMSWQPLICDAAIALAYLLLDKEDPLAVCANFLRGYGALRRPEPAELEILLDLIRSRLAVSIAISSYRQLREPDDPYITISQAPARATLDQLASIEREKAVAVFREAVAGMHD